MKRRHIEGIPTAFCARGSGHADNPQARGSGTTIWTELTTALASSTTTLHREGIKETIESVVVAFILAFVFRAFIVEAFVIPTGSMAATLYGRHGTITCESCGWEFAYGLADQTRDGGISMQPTVGPNSRAICPNCNYANTNLTINDINGPRGNAEAGDRILVLKWLFDLAWGDLGPDRWDVTVFKDPGPGGQNFIKRLVGVPNEVLEIIDGDVYTAPQDKLSPETLAALDRLRHVEYLQRDEHANGLSREQRQQVHEDSAAVRQGLDRVLTIQRKTPAAQQAMWTVIYDHDYPPRSPGLNQPRWASAARDIDCWDTSGRKIRCRGAGTEAGYLGFAGKTPIDDMCAYNLSQLGVMRFNHVSDLSLKFVLVPQAGQGLLALALSKRQDTFWADLAADGRVALYRTTGGRPTAADEPLAINRLDPLPLGQPIEVAFENVDYRVSLKVNGREVLATTDQQYAPDVPALRARKPIISAEPRFWAADLDFELWHVVLRRDVYYTSLGGEQTAPLPMRTGWGTEGHPIWLRSGEFFMLGDNSAASKDSRLWEQPGEHLLARGEQYQRGTVPRDQLIGRAFFVYWPSGHRSTLLPFLSRRGLIPNVGRMRWIR